MNLIFLRHAIAEDREEFASKGLSDESRKLTAEGIQRMEQIALGIKLLIPDLDLIAYSPYVRTRQTAEILCKQYPNIKATALDLLAPGHTTQDFFQWLDTLIGNKNVCVVGHNPEISEWLNASISILPSVLEMKKAGLACVAFKNRVATGAGELELYLTPKNLWSIGEKTAHPKRKK